MSRKKKAPKRIFYPDPKYKSLVLPKLINSLMKIKREKNLQKKQKEDLTIKKINYHHGWKEKI